jgi:hypothetical protein
MTSTRMLGTFVLLALGIPLLAGTGDPRTPPLRLSTFEFYSSHTAVSIDVEASGIARLATTGPKVNERRKLSREERRSLLGLIQDVGFFALDGQYGVCYVEGLSREISVELDGTKKRVGLCSLSTELVPEPQREGAVRAWRVWNAVRMLFPDHYPERSRHDAEELLAAVQRD